MWTLHLIIEIKIMAYYFRQIPTKFIQIKTLPFGNPKERILFLRYFHFVKRNKNERHFKCQMDNIRSAWHIMTISLLSCSQRIIYSLYYIGWPMMATSVQKVKWAKVFLLLQNAIGLCAARGWGLTYSYNASSFF